jgi:hypothetical protein
MTKKQAIKESLEHWLRMYNCVLTQPLNAHRTCQYFEKRKWLVKYLEEIKNEEIHNQTIQLNGR